MLSLGLALELWARDATPLGAQVSLGARWEVDVTPRDLSPYCQPACEPEPSRHALWIGAGLGLHFELR